MVALEIVRQVAPPAHVQELVYRGRRYDVDEARDLGYVHEVVSEERLMTKAMEAARELAELTVVRNTSEVTEEGRVRVRGEVRNVGPVAAREGKARVALVDENGLEVASAEVPLSPGELEPGAAASFEALFPGPAPTGVIKVELSWTS